MKNMKASAPVQPMKTVRKGNRARTACVRGVGFPVVPLTVLALFLSILAGFPALADQIDFWMKTPDNWEDRKSGLGRDLVKQILAPGGVAVIEVYGSRGRNPGVQVLADGMEREMLARGAAYLQTRVVDNRRRTADGHDAILREYSGVHNGVQLRAIALYTFGNGSALAAFGFYAENEGAQYRSALWESVGSIRFSRPGAAPAVSGPTAAVPGSTGAGTDHNTAATGCDAIIGTWKWFTGRNHTFGPNGTSSTAQVSWQCIDPQRRIVRINWSNGRFIDTLTISADGRRVEGQNQQGNRVWGIRHEPQPQPASVRKPPVPAAGSAPGSVAKVNPKCTPIIGTWRSEQNGRVITVTADGHLNGNPRYTWSCHPDGVRYNFRWDDGARVVVWDDLRMDPDKMHLTQRQAGQLWDRFVKVR